MLVGDPLEALFMCLSRDSSRSLKEIDAEATKGKKRAYNKELLHIAVKEAIDMHAYNMFVKMSREICRLKLTLQISFKRQN